jgi:hypothetical protein
MTTEEFPYWNEEETMKFLNYNESSMIALRKSKALTRYQIGHRYFYDPKEIEILIKSSKSAEFNKESLDRFVQSMFKEIGKSELKKQEKQFITEYGKRVLQSITIDILETLDINDKEKLVLTYCFENNGDFDNLAEKYHITRERGLQIFKRAMKIFFKKIRLAKEQYEKLILENKELVDNNTFLIEQNNKLKSELFKLNKDLYFFDDLEERNKVLLTNLNDLDISNRLLKIFTREKIETLGDIVSYKKRDFFNFRNFGHDCLSELENFLEQYGLGLN